MKIFTVSDNYGCRASFMLCSKKHPVFFVGVSLSGQEKAGTGLVSLLGYITGFISAFQVLLQYPKLKILYLHSNSIEKLSEIDKLASLPELISITLHGNPIESIPGYKQHIISTLPKLKTLDFIPITDQNRRDAQTWRVKFRKR